MATVNTHSPSMYNDDNERQTAALSFIEVLLPYFDSYNGFKINDAIKLYKQANYLEFEDLTLKKMRETNEFIKQILISENLAEQDSSAKYHIKLTQKGRNNKEAKMKFPLIIQAKTFVPDWQTNPPYAQKIIFSDIENNEFRLSYPGASWRIIEKDFDELINRFVEYLKGISNSMAVNWIADKSILNINLDEADLLYIQNYLKELPFIEPSGGGTGVFDFIFIKDEWKNYFRGKTYLDWKKEKDEADKKENEQSKLPFIYYEDNRVTTGDIVGGVVAGKIQDSDFLFSNKEATINPTPKTIPKDEKKSAMLYRAWQIITENKLISGIILLVFGMIIKKMITGKWF